jgi:hypothetical protein
LGDFISQVGDLGDFEFGGDGVGDALEFPRFFQRAQKICEGREGHAITCSPV